MTVHIFLRSVLALCARVFSTRAVFLVVTALLATIALVLSGFDWLYYVYTRSSVIWALLIPVAPLGFFVPLLTPPLLWSVGYFFQKPHLKTLAFLIAEAELAAWLISSGLKGLTGRIHPELTTSLTALDTSRVFNIGFLKEGIFWGWPSSHTAVAFAGATIIQRLYPRTWWASIATVYAWYIGIGVSATIHWFSDFVAGALVGRAVGLSARHTIDKHH